MQQLEFKQSADIFYQHQKSVTDRNPVGSDDAEDYSHFELCKAVVKFGFDQSYQRKQNKEKKLKDLTKKKKQHTC